MVLEDKDFIMRQVQQLAEGIGKFLGKESIKELINYDQTQEDALTDDEIETILLIVNVKEIQNQEKLSNKEVSTELGISENDLDHLYKVERSATSAEFTALNRFIDKYAI